MNLSYHFERKLCKDTSWVGCGIVTYKGMFVYELMRLEVGYPDIHHTRFSAFLLFEHAYGIIFFKHS